MKEILFAVLIFSGSALGLTGDTGQILGTAGQVLAQVPLQDDSLNDVVAEELPTFHDLAVSRLQSKVNEVIDQAWKIFNDEREIRKISEKGLAHGILKIFNLLKNDIFALDQQLDGSKIEYSLKTLAVPTNEASEWIKTYTNFSKILSKVKLHYRIFNDYMNNAETTSQLELEDFARSIIQPGSTQQTALLTTLDNLNDLAIPNDHSNSKWKRISLTFRSFLQFIKYRINLRRIRSSPSILTNRWRIERFTL